MTTWWDGRLRDQAVESVSARADLWGPGVYVVLVLAANRRGSTKRVADWGYNAERLWVDTGTATPGAVEAALAAGWCPSSAAPSYGVDWVVRP